MSSLLTEISGPSASASPSTRARILKGGRSRAARAVDSSTNSLTSNDTAGDRSSAGLGSSWEAHDTESNHHSTKVGTEIAKIKNLLPSRRRKERKFQQSTAQLDHSLLSRNGENEANASASSAGERIAALMNESRDSSQYARSDGSSLLTEDSDVEGSVWNRYLSGITYHICLFCD